MTCQISTASRLIVYLAITLVSIIVLGADRAYGATLTFSPQTGLNGANFVSDTELGFTVVPTTANNWFQGQMYGNPTPSIFDGPIGSPSVATIEVTRGGSQFSFDSIDYSSNNGPSDYTITGILDDDTVFTETGTFPGVNPPFSFSTYFAGVDDSMTPIDTLDVTVTPLAGNTSVNFDNIGLGTLVGVPEPASASILVGMVALGLRRRAR